MPEMLRVLACVDADADADAEVALDALEDDAFEPASLSESLGSSRLAEISLPSTTFIGLLFVYVLLLFDILFEVFEAFEVLLVVFGLFVVLLFSVSFVVVELEVPFKFTFVSLFCTGAAGRETEARTASLLVRGVVVVEFVVEFVVVVGMDLA